MPTPNTIAISPEAATTILREVREDLIAFRRQVQPITAFLLHQVSGDGPLSTDRPSSKLVAWQATHSLPVLIALNGPWAKRSLYLFHGNEPATAHAIDQTQLDRLRAITNRCFAYLPNDIPWRQSDGFNWHGGPESLWWMLVSEMSWSGRHAYPGGRRVLWTESRFVAYDQETLSAVKGHDHYHIGDEDAQTCPICRLAAGIPDQWLEHLPASFACFVEDAVSASINLVDELAGLVDNAHDNPRGPQTNHTIGKHAAAILRLLTHVAPKRMQVTEIQAEWRTDDELPKSRDATSRAIKQLVKAGLVSFPEGPRSGVGITQAGQDSLTTLQAQNRR